MVKSHSSPLWLAEFKSKTTKSVTFKDSLSLCRFCLTLSIVEYYWVSDIFPSPKGSLQESKHSPHPLGTYTLAVKIKLCDSDWGIFRLGWPKASLKTHMMKQLWHKGDSHGQPREKTTSQCLENFKRQTSTLAHYKNKWDACNSWLLGHQVY